MSDDNDRETMPARLGARKKSDTIAEAEFSRTRSKRDTEIDEVMREIRKPLVDRLEYAGRLAEGGMGTIELVSDRALERVLAKKIIHPDLSLHERAMWMFVREARVTSQLDHPNIVPVHHMGEDRSGDLFFTMKRVEGRSLSELLADFPTEELRRDDLVRVLTVLTKVCDALAFAHSRGVLHCDLKPGNIMVGDYGEAYLMDWGIARALDGSVPDAVRVEGGAEATLGLSSTAIMGTPNYMSPEQARGERSKLTVQSDIFSLGAVLYRVLAGRPPYTGRDETDVVDQARRADIQQPSAIRGAKVPVALEQLAMQALRLDPAERPRTVREFQHQLESYLYGGGEFPTVTYMAGEVIIAQGDVGETAYIVVSGSCRAFLDVGGERKDLGELGVGAIFGETAILTAAPRAASVVAEVDNTVLYQVTREVLEAELADLKPWLATLVRTLAERFLEERSQRG